MEKQKAAMVTYVSYNRTPEKEYFYNICCRDMNGCYHNLLFRPQKIKEIQKEWGTIDTLHCLGNLALLSGEEGSKVASLMKTRSYNLAHHNDNNLYSLVDSEVLWELGSNGT